MLTYEQQLDRDYNLAALEGDRYFQCRSAVHQTMRQFAARIEAFCVNYAVAGDLCMFFHGYRRFSQLVEMLVSEEGLDEIHRRLVGDGYDIDGKNSRYLRDSENGVRIKFVVAAESLCDEPDVPIVVPHPNDAKILLDNIYFVDIVPLIEMKLVRGRASYRLREIGYAQELIRYLELPRDFSKKLNAIVRESYEQVWHGAQTAKLDDY